MEYLEQIGAHLGIVKAPSESRIEYERRIAYSAIADWMQTSVYVGGETTSIVRVKNIAKDKARMFEELTPNIFIHPVDTLIDHIYDIILSNGVFLHSHYAVRPAPHRLIGNDSFAIVRGMYPEEPVCYSGLAPYTKQSFSPCNIYAAFGLPETSAESITEQLWKRGNPVSNDIQVNEFLNTRRVGTQPYFCPSSPDASGMLFGRSRRDTFAYDYYLICDNEVRRISEDHIHVGLHEYARLYLMIQKQPQTATVTFDGTDLVHLTFSFHLPQPDLRFLQYLSWPYRDAGPEDLWRFSLHSNLWPIVEERLQFLAYKVVKKHA